MPSRSIEQRNACVQRCLRKLNRAHVVLRDLHFRRALAAAGRQRSCRSRQCAAKRGHERAVKNAILVDDAGQEHFRDNFDDSGTAHAGDARGGGRRIEARIVRP